MIKLKTILNEGVNESDLKGYLIADVVDDIIKVIGPRFVSGEIKQSNRNKIYLKLTDVNVGSGVVKLLKSKFGIDAKEELFGGKDKFGSIPSVSFFANKVINEAGLKGAESVPSNKRLSQLSDNDKLKIVQSVGNLISFKVPDWSKGRRNFWTVISNGKIVQKKNLDGITIFILPGKGPEKVSPSYSSVKDLLNGVDWDTMELRRESVNEVSYKVAGRPVTLIKGKKSDATDWKVKFQNGKETSLSDVLALIKPFPKGVHWRYKNLESVKEGVSDIKGFRNKPADTWNDTMIKLVLMRKIEGKTAVYRLETDNWFRRFENPGKGYGLMIRGIKIAAQPTKAPSSFAYGENQSVFKVIVQYLPNEFDNVEDDVKENYETAQGYIILGNKNFTGFEMQQVLSIKDLEGFVKANMGDYNP
jgi:hypothetical protein